MGETGVARARSGLPIALRVLLIVGFAIALAATALVVFADDVRMLRLAAVLALWAALIAAFAVTRSRRDARAAVMREGEAHLAYQLELHREVAARREYEADLSQQVASAQADQLTELREQLERLTGVLSSLADGELTVSRLTLSAESARFRPGLAGQQRLPVAAGSTPPSVTVGDGFDGVPAELGWVEAEPGAAPPAGEDPGAPGTATASAAGRSPVVGPDGGRFESPSAAWSRRHAHWARDREERPERAGAERAPEPAEAPAPAGALETDEPGSGDENPGDHESGVSVADLLAAYGLADRPRRRRRD